MGALVPSELVDLAGRINVEHAAAVGSLRTALEHARVAGELLQEARQHCPYGTWLPWLQDHVSFSERTAQGYMRLAQRWPELEAARNARPVADLGVREALALLAAPAEQERDGAAVCVCDWDEDRWRAEAGLPPRTPIDVGEFLRFVNEGEVPAAAETAGAAWERVCDYLLSPDRPRWLPCCDKRAAAEAIQMADRIVTMAGRWPAVPIWEVLALWGGFDVLQLLTDVLMFGDIPGGQAALRRLWPLVSVRMAGRGAG